MMDEQQNMTNRPVNPRRRKRTQIEIFKEAYLPAIIACVALLLILIFIIGSASRAIQNKRSEKDAGIAASQSLQQEQDRLNAEAAQLISEANALAAKYSYADAIARIDTFTGNIEQFPELSAKRQELATALDNMVVWDDPGKVLNLSFQVLIADPNRAFQDANYASSYNRNFVTTGEFSKILQQLYDNGYILVSLDDFLTTKTTDTGAVIYEAKPMLLPKGKKPLVLTQTQVNYYYYMVDADKDGFPNQDGAGFASRLVLDDNNKITCEMVDSNGKTVTGNFDLVPILDDFVALHPDFSYNGAKAILAVTGHEGLFGYRTQSAAADLYGVSMHEQAVSDVSKIVSALRASGYDIACYTFENRAYGNMDAAQIRADLSGWFAEVAPIVGSVDILVYAQESDISEGTGLYTTDSFRALYESGFRYYLGFCTNGTSWSFITDDYVRQGRIMVTGSNLKNNAGWFSGIFDPASVLDATRAQYFQ